MIGEILRMCLSWPKGKLSSRKYLGSLLSSPHSKTFPWWSLKIEVTQKLNEEETMSLPIESSNRFLIINPFLHSVLYERCDKNIDSVKRRDHQKISYERRAYELVDHMSIS